MRNNFIKAALLVLSAVGFSGCAVGPDHKSPDAVADIPLTAPYAPAPEVLSWWQAFADPDLNMLINLGLENNRTLAQARANVDRAYSVFRDVDNDRWPVGLLQAGYQAGENQTPAQEDNNTITRTYLTGLGLNWDLDLFGKLQRATEAAEANAEYAALQWQDARLQLISQIAITYGDYRGSQLRLAVATDNLANLEQTRAIVQARLEVGTVSDMELALIEAQIYQLQADIYDLEFASVTAETALAALVGQRPGTLALDDQRPLPQLSQPIAIASGIDYLRHRADVASAERLLASRTAAVGIATADLYPNISVNGFLGFLSSPGLSIGSEQSSWSIAPTLTWQALDFASVTARIRAADASQRMAYAQFEQQVFNALADMELALQSYNISRQQQLKVEQQLAANQTAVSIARDRYETGTAEFLELLDAERQLLRTRDRVAQMQQINFSRLVGIYRSFGGSLQPDRA